MRCFSRQAFCDLSSLTENGGALPFIGRRVLDSAHGPVQQLRQGALGRVSVLSVLRRSTGRVRAASRARGAQGRDRPLLRSRRLHRRLAADPEDVRSRIRPYHARLRQEIEGYGGTVEKFIGDAAMAVFGAPVAHEDDAERAVRAGLRILEAIEELNEQEPALSLQVRIGVNTGEAVVALGSRPEEGEGIVTGDVVNTASRLQGAAQVNGIAVSEQTYRQTERVFDYEELDPVQVKGKTEPLALYRPLAARARLGSDVTRTHTAPLVGRELEKPLLIGAFERSVQQRSCQLVTIVGEPGVGKSRLCAELFGYIEDRPGQLVRWRQGRCLPYGEGIAFWALGEIVKAECGILESDSPDEVEAKLERAVAEDDPDRSWLLARLAPLVGATAEPAGKEEAVEG